MDTIHLYLQYISNRDTINVFWNYASEMVLSNLNKALPCQDKSHPFESLLQRAGDRPPQACLHREREDNGDSEGDGDFAQNLLE